MSALRPSVSRSLRASPWAALPPGRLVLPAAVAVVVWLATGVRPLEIVGFAAYHLAFVLGPGVLLLRALLRSRGSPLTQLAIGWALGHAVELAAFAATAAVGARWLFFLYPPLVCGQAVVATRRRPPDAPARPARVPLAPAWTTAAVVAGAIVLLGLGAFAANPLPRSVPSVVLIPDNVFHVALAAEARHHWPMRDPNVSGEPLRYHVFVHMQAAAVAQTTGIPIDVVVLRLQPVLIMLLIGLQLAWLAARVARASPWVAPGAVAIMLLANELDLDSERDSPFAGLFFTDFPQSPTFAFGLVFFIPALGILAAALSHRARQERGTWVVLGALFVGAMGAKASTLPVLLAGLGLFFIARLVLDRSIDRRALGAGALAFAAFVVVYLALFSGAGAVGGKIELLAFLDYQVLAGAFTGGISALLLDLVRTAALMAPWLGGLLLIGRVAGPDRNSALWLAAVAVGAFLPFAVFAQPALAQIYFLNYGTPAAAVLSAWGIARAWPAARDRAVPMAAIGAAIAAALVVAAVFRDRWPEEETGLTVVGYLGPYAVLAAVLLLIAIIAGRSPRAAFAWLITLVLAATLLDKPLDVLPTWVEKEAAGDRHYEVDQRDGPRGIDQGLLKGFGWLRENTGSDDVLATNIATTTATGEEARYFYPAAFAERRTFLGGWEYSSEAIKHDADDRPGLPFAERRALGDAAYRGDRHALAVLRGRYGVRFLLEDLRHGVPRDELEGRLIQVYADPALRIYRLR